VIRLAIPNGGASRVSAIALFNRSSFYCFIFFFCSHLLGPIVHPLFLLFLYLLSRTMLSASVRVMLETPYNLADCCWMHKRWAEHLRSHSTNRI